MKIKVVPDSELPPEIRQSIQKLRREVLGTENYAIPSNSHFTDARINRLAAKQKKIKRMLLAKTPNNLFYIAPEVEKGFPEPGILRVGVHNDLGLTIRPAGKPLYLANEDLKKDGDVDSAPISPGLTGTLEGRYEDGDGYMIVDGDKEPVKDYFPLENYCSSLKEFEADINVFLAKKEFYQKFEIAYKRNYLLFGGTGTGKTQKIYHTVNKLISERGAYVIEIKDFDDAHTVLAYDDKLAQIFADKFLVFWVEELWNLTRGDEDRIAVLLNLLDNKHLSKNIIWLITTNHPEELPANLIDRPSRIDRLIEVNPSQYDKDLLEAWYAFLYGEPPDFTGMAEAEIKEARGLSIAYLKEWFVYSRLNEMSLAEGYQRIVARKKLIKDNFKQNKKGMGFI